MLAPSAALVRISVLNAGLHVEILTVLEASSPSTSSLPEPGPSCRLAGFPQRARRADHIEDSPTGTMRENRKPVAACSRSCRRSSRTPSEHPDPWGPAQLRLRVRPPPWQSSRIATTLPRFASLVLSDRCVQCRLFVRRVDLNGASKPNAIRQRVLRFAQRVPPIDQLWNDRGRGQLKVAVESEEPVRDDVVHLQRHQACGRRRSCRAPSTAHVHVRFGTPAWSITKGARLASWSALCEPGRVARRILQPSAGRHGARAFSRNCHGSRGTRARCRRLAAALQRPDTPRALVRRACARRSNALSKSCCR